MDRDDALIAETRAFCVELERALAGVAPVHTLPPEQTRRDRREGRGLFPAPVFLEHARVVEVEGAAGPLVLRVFAPEAPAAGVFLHIHGGGWTLGGADMQDPRLDALARATGLVVASVEYRLAPERPYPAAADDCEAAARWLVKGGAGELAAGRDAPVPLAIGGDSAGAHLAALTLLRLRDTGLGGAFAAAVFQYGAFDLSMTPSQRRWGERNLVLSTPIIAWFAENFLPGTSAEQRRDPAISPLYADLGEMPPALFTIGTEDPLLDDTLFMEARWRAAGHATELHVWCEAPHGFISLPMRVAGVAGEAEVAFLRRTLALA